MSRHIILDPTAPMASLRAADGLTKAEMARARGVTAPTIDSSEAAGAGVRLSTLIEAAATVGCRVEIHLVKERS